MDEDRTTYLAAIKETCNRQVEEEVRGIKQHYEDEARIVKKQYEMDVQKVKTRYEERISQCQEDLQREYNSLLTQELEIQRRHLQIEQEETIKALLTEETKRILASLEEEARVSKKKYQSDVKKQWKVRYDEGIRQCQEDLQREYNLLWSEKLETRERQLISQYEERIKVLSEEHTKKETDLRMQLAAMEQKCDNTLVQLDRHWNDQLSECVKMLTMEAEEKVRLDVTVLHEKYINMVKEKDALLSSLNDDKSNAISDYELLLKECKQLELDKSVLKSKARDLRSALRHAESSFTEKLSAYDQDKQEMEINAKEMQSDIFRLHKALETEARRRSTNKADFLASEEQWSKERNELNRIHHELTEKYTMNDRLKSEEIVQLQRNLQQSRDERDLSESKLKSLQKQRGLQERDMDLVTMQLEQQADAVVSLQHKHEQDILALQGRHLDLLKDSDEKWGDKCQELKKEAHKLRQTVESAVHEKEDAITKAASSEKKLLDMTSQSSIDLSNKEHELSAVKDNFQVVSSKLLNAQEENSRLKEMIGMMRKDMDLMISMKPQDTKSAATSDRRLEEILCNVLTTVRDKLNSSEKTTCSIQLDSLVATVNDLKSSVVAMNSSQSQEHEQRYQHLYSEFLIILDERNRLVEISNQLQAEIQQLKLKSGDFNEEETSSVENDPAPDEIETQDLAKSLWTNAMRVLPSTSALPPRSTDRVTESQRKVRRRMQREHMKKIATNSCPRDINVRNWNKKED